MRLLGDMPKVGLRQLKNRLSSTCARYARGARFRSRTGALVTDLALLRLALGLAIVSV
jgi:hypothetical protein